MKTYGRKVFKRQTQKMISPFTETEDGILWDIDWDNYVARIKIQGSDEYVNVHFPRNEATIPLWMKPRNAVRVLHRSGNRGYAEIIGHGLAIPTPLPGSASHPNVAGLSDGVISGCEVTATSPASMSVTINNGTYRIDETIYDLIAGTVGYYSSSESAPPITTNETYPEAVTDQTIRFIETSESAPPMATNEYIPFASTDDIVTTFELDPAPTGANYARYDTFQVGTDGIIDYVKGTASTNPSKPSISTDHVQLGEYILVYQGITVIKASNIGQQFTDREIAFLEIDAIDEFDYDNGDDYPETNVKVEARDQYGWLLTGTYTLTLKLIVGTGQVWSLQSGWQDVIAAQNLSASSYTFKYRRDQTETETSPIFLATLSGTDDETAFHRIELLDIFGNPVTGSTGGGDTGTYQELTSATNIEIDWSKGYQAKVTAAHNITFTFTGAADGSKLILMIRQDATGSRTITLPSNVVYGDDIGSVTVSTDANSRSYIGFIYDAATSKYDLVANTSGYTT